MTPRQSIVVPCYNESRGIPSLVERFAALRTGDGDPWELVLVDNGSTDGSAEVLADAHAAIRSLADEPCTEVLDLRSLLAEDRGAWADPVHVSAAGTEAISRAVGDALADGAAAPC